MGDRGKSSEASRGSRGKARMRFYGQFAKAFDSLFLLSDGALRSEGR